MTDIHISQYHHPDIKADLEEFFSTTLDTVQPTLVLMSGDITDAKSPDGLLSHQLEFEWSTYSDLLVRHNVLEKTTYLDLRGNHDALNVPGYNHPDNFFRLHGAVGRVNPTSYIHTVNHSGASYAFVAVDATPDPGPSKMFNFLGHLTELQYNMLDRIGQEARKADRQVYNYTFKSLRHANFFVQNYM